MPRTFTPTEGEEEPNIFQAASASPTDDIEKLAGTAEPKWEDEATFLHRLTPDERRRLLGLIPGEKTASTKVEAELPDDVESLRREREEILKSISERKKKHRKVSTKWSVKAAERLADGRRQKEKRKASSSRSPSRGQDLPESFDLQRVVDTLKAETVDDAAKKRRATGLSDPDEDLAEIIGNLQSQVESKDATIHMLNSELVSCRSLVSATESRAKEALFQILEIIGHPNPPESMDPLVECTFSALHTFLTQLHAEMNELRTQKEAAELEKRHAQAMTDDVNNDDVIGIDASENELRRIVDRQAKKIHYLEDKVSLQEEEISRQKAALQAALSSDSRQALACTYPLRDKPSKGGDSPIKRLDSELESFRMQLADWKNTDKPFSTGGMIKAARSHVEQLSRNNKTDPASPSKQSNGDFGTGKSSAVDTMATQDNLRDTVGSVPLNDSVAETFQSKIRETWYMPVHAKGRYETAVALIRELRRRLNCEKHEHENLKVKYEELQSEYQYAVEVLRDDVNNLRTNEEELVGEVERLLDENTILSTDLRLKSEELNSLKSAAQKEVTNTQTLRELYMRSLNSGSRTKKPAWDKFWKELATPEVLETSKPPGMFPVEELNVATKAEYKKLVEESKVHDIEMRKILEERDLLVVERDELVKWKSHETKKIDRKFRLQEQHLVGAVRRIKFLVEERKKCEKSCTFKDKYILKLESQILKLKAALRKARQANSAYGSVISGGNQSGVQGSFSYWDATAKLSGVESPTRSRRSKLNSVLGTEGGINEEGDEEVVDVLNESMQSMTRAEYNMFLRSTDEVSQSLMLGTSALNDDEANVSKGEGNWQQELYSMAFDESANIGASASQGNEGGPSSTLNLSLSASRASNLLDGSLEPRKEALEQEAKRQGVMKKTKQQQQQQRPKQVAASGDRSQEGPRTITNKHGATVGSKRLAWSPGPGVTGYATQRLVSTSSQHEKRTREVQRVAKRSASTPPTQERQAKSLASTAPAQSQRETPSKRKTTPNQSRALTPQERGTPITVSASERHLPGQEPPSRAAQREISRGGTPGSTRNNRSVRTPGTAPMAREPSMEMASSAHNPRYRRGFIGEQEQRVLSFEEELDMFLEQED